MSGSGSPSELLPGRPRSAPPGERPNCGGLERSAAVKAVGVRDPEFGSPKEALTASRTRQLRRRSSVQILVP